MSTQQQGIVDTLGTLMATVTGIVTTSKNRPMEEPFALNQLPAINVTAIKSAVLEEHSAGTDERLTVIISVFTSGATAANSALDYLAAALTKIGADETLSGKAIDSRKGERILATKKNETITAEAHHEIFIDYRTPRWGF